MKKQLFLALAFLFFSASFFAQTHYNTFTNDNFSGSFGPSLNPASLSDNRYKWSVGFGGNYTYSNNYIGTSINQVLYGSEDQSAYKEPRFNGYYAELVELNLVNAFIELTPFDAIGYSWKIKQFTNFDGLSDELTGLDFNSFTGPQIGQEFFQGRLSYTEMRWAEHNLTYSRTLVDKKKRFMKAGVTFKILNGLDSRYLFTEGGNVTFNANQQLTFNDMEFQYGESDQANQLSSTNIGFGMDLGFVYEHRPEYKKYFYEMDGRRRNPSTHENKYKWKAGASITNIGGIRFTKDTNSYNFVNNNNNTVNFTDLFNNVLAQDYIQDNVLPTMTNNQDAGDTNYRVSLPTAINLMFDYRILPNIYLNYTGSIPVWLRSDPSKVHDMIIHTVSGRYEKAGYAVGVPITFQRNGQLNLGVYGRVKNVFFGANNVTGIIGQRRLYNANIYAGIVLGKKHEMPSDKDGDLISDAIDLCPLDSGGRRMKGCPDADGDKIPDYKDFCPYVFGPRKYNGCPDTDKDGIMDYEDNCPTEKGLRANKGCPDRDQDGIIDEVDRCPTVPGVYENNGCPLEPLVCCLDSDGDGISDAIDSCAYEPGPARNNGCPEGKVKTPKAPKVKYPKVEKKDIEQTLEEAKTEMKRQSVKEVLETRSTIDDLNVYFDVDKSNIQSKFNSELDGFADKINQSAKVVILVLGHTDSDGDNAYNLALSQRRSEAVKKYLLKKGVNEDRIVIKSYGEERPATENTNSQNKAQNRRVEVRMMSLHN